MSGPSGNFIIDGAQSVTEDLSWFRGAIIGCGEASALVIAHILKGTPLSPQQVTDLITSAANANQLSGAGGGQTAPNVQWDLAQFGIQSNIQGWQNSGFGPGKMFDLIDSALRAGKPIEIGVSNGAALTNESSGLRGHYITLVGEQNGKFVAADPNTAESKSSKFVSESWQQILDANPFALILPSGTGTTAGTSNTNDNSSSGGWTNPFDIGSAIQGALLGAFSAPFKSVGVTTPKDFFWRAALVALAIILLIVGLVALVGDFVQKNPEALAAAA